VESAYFQLQNYILQRLNSLLVDQKEDQKILAKSVHCKYIHQAAAQSKVSSKVLNVQRFAKRPVAPIINM